MPTGDDVIQHIDQWYHPSPRTNTKSKSPILAAHCRLFTSGTIFSFSFWIWFDANSPSRECCRFRHGRGTRAEWALSRTDSFRKSLSLVCWCETGWSSQEEEIEEEEELSPWRGGRERSVFALWARYYAERIHRETRGAHNWTWRRGSG